MKHQPQIIKAFLSQYGIPEPVFELKFHPIRRWRFDLAWPIAISPVALEIQGGIFIQGRHSRGAALLKEWEKLNTAAEMGWRVIYCQPRDLLTKQTATTIRKCLGLE